MSNSYKKNYKMRFDDDYGEYAYSSKKNRENKNDAWKLARRKRVRDENRISDKFNDGDLEDENYISWSPEFRQFSY